MICHKTNYTAAAIRSGKTASSFRDKRPNSKKEKTTPSGINNYIIPRLGATKLEDLAAPMIQHFYNDLLRPRKPGAKPLTAKTVRCVHGIFHSALSKAVQLGYIRMNPSDACELPRAVRKEIVPLEDEQIAAFLKAIVAHPHVETCRFLSCLIRTLKMPQS